MRPVLWADDLTIFLCRCLEIWNLNFLEHSGSLQACNGTALPLHMYYSNYAVNKYTILSSKLVQIILSLWVFKWQRLMKEICLIIRGGSHAAAVLGSFIFRTNLGAYMGIFLNNWKCVILDYDHSQRNLTENKTLHTFKNLFTNYCE